MSQLLMSQQALKLHVSPTLKPQLLPSLRSSFLSSTFTVPTLGVRTEPLGTGLKVGSGGVLRRKMTMAALPGLMPHPDSTLLYVMEFFLAASGPLQMHSEATGKKNMNYSKFAGADGSKQAMVPSRTGMFFCYFPAAVAATVFLAYIVGLLPLASILESVGASGVASFLQHALTASDDRLLLVAAALSIHHVKRCLEVLFVHKPSGSTGIDAVTVISSSYLSQTCLLLYSQLLSAGTESQTPNLQYLGVALFLTGIAGNAYHHWKLAHLRKDGSKSYVVPRGGLFEIFVCPHYVFEMVDYVGVALISQTLFGWCMASFTIFYLTGRSIATKDWYKKKVDGFPEDRSVVIPGIF
ncbi:hypothetical protein KC19_6G047800 [Ceratodon purpureus]|uniref:3-oxo-5-alpha-steroid 4-dehydrogenase C-terminal domain-containing protein n=1 Tax=Ceratodon purpureus TaxID=3225 RepID=A0A8T0HFG6_CERPU|nr:hypothetical protein KC19_6G047800 [Ceratodon purpureus]